MLCALAQVMAFWDKAQRVVLYKVKSEVEARKKEVMDRQVGAGILCVAAIGCLFLALQPAGCRHRCMLFFSRRCNLLVVGVAMVCVRG